MNIYKHNSRKLISVLLAIVMAFGTLAVLPFTATAADETTVYYVNSDEYAEVYAYTYTTGGGQNQGWPGVAATKTAETVGDYDVYSYDADGYDYVIFNNNGNGKQTGNLATTEAFGKYYLPATGLFYDSAADAEAALASAVTYDWYAVGSEALFGVNWQTSPTSGMTEQADGSYVLTLTDVAAGTYECKVTDGNGTWYPSGDNVEITVPESGSSVEITLSSSKVVTATVTAPAATTTEEIATTTEEVATTTEEVATTTEEVATTTEEVATTTEEVEETTTEAQTVINGYLTGGWNSWTLGLNPIENGTATITLEANTTYEFKITASATAWSDNADLSGGSAITKDNNSTTLSAQGGGSSNASIVTDAAGDYVFTFDSATNTLTVTYPEAVEETTTEAVEETTTEAVEETTTEAVEETTTEAVEETTTEAVEETTTEAVEETTTEAVEETTTEAVEETTTEAQTVINGYLTGSWNSWTLGLNPIENGTATITLEANTTYEFKITASATAWSDDADLSGGSAITKDSNSTTLSAQGGGSSNASIVTDAAGDYVFTFDSATNTLTVTYPEAVEETTTEAEEETTAPAGETTGIYGDADGNGIITVADATAMQKLIVLGAYSAQLDVDLDGDLDVVDVTAVLKYIAGSEDADYEMTGQPFGETSTPDEATKDEATKDEASEATGDEATKDEASEATGDEATEATGDEATEATGDEAQETDPEEETNAVYFVSGDSYDLFGGNSYGWPGNSASASTQAIMVLNEDGTYTATLTDVTATSLNFKVVMETTDESGTATQTWIGGGETGNDNFAYTVTDTTVAITYDPTSGAVTVTGATEVTALEITSVYAVGSADLLNGASWVTNAAANEMTEVSDGVYQLTLSNVAMSATPYEIKFVANPAGDSDWTYQWGVDGAVVVTTADYVSDFEDTEYYDIVSTYGTDALSVVMASNPDSIKLDVPYDYANITVTLDLTSFDYSAKTGAVVTVAIEEVVSE